MCDRTAASARVLLLLLPLLGVISLAGASDASAQVPPRVVVEIEAGGLWQSRNKVQIPNDAAGTRFSLTRLTGSGPWQAGRLYVTWNINQRHGLRVLLAPLSLTGNGSSPGPVAFAGEVFEPGVPVGATYRFNSWRLTYEYRFLDHESLDLWAGLTAKIRDAEIELRQAGVVARDTDVGFVPLLHLAADKRVGPRWRLLFDFDGLAGGPGRAFDAALKVGYDLADHWGVSAGYRTLEGGADVESVYSFAWFHYAVVSGVLRF